MSYDHIKATNNQVNYEPEKVRWCFAHDQWEFSESWALTATTKGDEAE